MAPASPNPAAAITGLEVIVGAGIASVAATTPVSAAATAAAVAASDETGTLGPTPFNTELLPTGPKASSMFSEAAQYPCRSLLLRQWQPPAPGIQSVALAITVQARKKLWRPQHREARGTKKRCRPSRFPHPRRRPLPSSPALLPMKE